jgi:hypothetical protein
MLSKMSGADQTEAIPDLRNRLSMVLSPANASKCIICFCCVVVSVLHIKLTFFCYLVSLLAQICAAQSIIDLSFNSAEHLKPFFEWYKTLSDAQKASIHQDVDSTFRNCMAQV